MRIKRKQSGLSLMELLVVIAVMMVLMGVSIPAAKKLTESFENTTSIRQLINAAMSNARSIAIREQAYAGVRFQEDTDGNTYMTFIIHDPTDNRADGFRVVKGRKPMKLPEDTGIITREYFNRQYGVNGNLLSAVQQDLTDAVLTDNAANMVDIAGKDKNLYYLDATSFSIVFNPSGKLTTKLVWIRNLDSIADTPGENGNNSTDTIFNKKDVVDASMAMFYQDDYGGSPKALYTGNYGIGPEWSQQSFFIFSKKEYKASITRMTYLSKIDLENINPYTGELIIEYIDK